MSYDTLRHARHLDKFMRYGFLFGQTEVASIVLMLLRMEKTTWKLSWKLPEERSVFPCSSSVGDINTSSVSNVKTVMSGCQLLCTQSCSEHQIKWQQQMTAWTLYGGWINTCENNWAPGHARKRTIVQVSVPLLLHGLFEAAVENLVEGSYPLLHFHFAVGRQQERALVLHLQLEGKPTHFAVLEEDKRSLL